MNTPSKVRDWSVLFVTRLGLAVAVAVGLMPMRLPAQPVPAPTPGSGLVLQFSQDKPVAVTVAGVVRARDTGAPIPNAQVRGHIVVQRFQGPDLFDRCPYQETVTDAQGRYQLRFVTPLTTSGAGRGDDTLCVYASAPGFETKPQYGRPAVTARNAAFTDFNFQLGPGKKLRGRVVDPAGQPVSGAFVRVQNGYNGDWEYFGALGRTFTGSDGVFELWTGSSGAEHPGAHAWLNVLKPGTGTHIAWDILTKEDLGTLQLNPGGDLLGKVVDANGAPLPDCEVMARLYPFEVVATARTDAQGQYHLRSVPGEPGMTAFYRKKNGRYDPAWSKVDVYARARPDLALNFAPHCQVVPKDGQMVRCPDLSLAAGSEVAGVLVPSKTALGLGGLMVRLDAQWEHMVEADIHGRFRFPFVPPGKHRLTAYLPHNLRYDRGIGSTEIDLKPGQPIKDVKIQLIDLAELRVQYLDAQGNPLSGITAGASWSRSGDGAWTEGTVSDEDGWAVLYLYPEGPQFLRGLHQLNQLVTETAREVQPEPGQVLEPMQIVMVPAAHTTGRLLKADQTPVARQRVLATLNYADGTRLLRPLQTEADGSFQLESITPGVVDFGVELGKIKYAKVPGKTLTIAPGQKLALGDLMLKSGVDPDTEIRAKHAGAMQQPEQIRQAAEDLFRRIQGADYDQFLKPNADWQRFPIVGRYQTYQWFDFLVQWMSSTFKTNPIVKVELGEVYANTRTINGHKGLPTVSYTLTLKNGALLQGDLPFEYNYDGGQGHWHGIEGLDWHLKKRRAD